MLMDTSAIQSNGEKGEKMIIMGFVLNTMLVREKMIGMGY